MYLGKRKARIRNSANHPDIKPEWVVVAFTKEIKLQYEIVGANKTKILNWWGYALEIFANMSETDYRELPYVILCRNKKS